MRSSTTRRRSCARFTSAVSAPKGKAASTVHMPDSPQSSRSQRSVWRRARRRLKRSVLRGNEKWQGGRRRNVSEMKGAVTAAAEASEATGITRSVAADEGAAGDVDAETFDRDYLQGILTFCKQARCSRIQRARNHSKYHQLGVYAKTKSAPDVNIIHCCATHFGIRNILVFGSCGSVDRITHSEGSSIFQTQCTLRYVTVIVCSVSTPSIFFLGHPGKAKENNIHIEQQFVTPQPPPATSNQRANAFWTVRGRSHRWT